MQSVKNALTSSAATEYVHLFKAIPYEPHKQNDNSLSREKIEEFQKFHELKSVDFGTLIWYYLTEFYIKTSVVS